jgi:hypothetical protein
VIGRTLSELLNAADETRESLEQTGREASRRRPA